VSAVIAISVFGLDRWSKWLVETNLGFDSVKTVIPGFFNIIRSENTGVAFSMFAEGGGRWHTIGLVTLSLAAILVLAFMLWKIERLDRISAVALSLIFGGAIGNVWDRVYAGAVTDFLDFYFGTYHWYTFNVADSAICTGAGLLMLSMFLTRNHEETRA
jgi:signal peptidase II